MALNYYDTMALNMLGTMALKSDLNSAKVISRRLMALCHEKPQVLIITNKDFFLLCLMALKVDLIVPRWLTS